jgi:hypothetical protein
MTTSHTTFRRCARRSALALIVSATLVPASSALAQGDTPADYPGMPGSPQTPPPVASHATEASGFDWTSGAIGAGAAGVLIVISLGGAAAAPRLRFRKVRS